MVTLLEIRTLLESPALTGTATAGIIVLTSVILAHFLASAVDSWLRATGLLEKIRARGIRNPAGLVETVLRYLIIGLAVLAAINRLGLNLFVTVLAGVSVGGLTLYLFYWYFKDLIVNFGAGIILKSEGRIKEGDTMTVSDITGKVKSFGWTEIALETKEKELIVIPNVFVLRRKVVHEVGKPEPKRL